MKLGLITTMFWCTGLIANHTGEPGTAEYLNGEAHELNILVQISSLSYSVKKTVADFSWEAGAFNQCVENHGSPQGTQSDNHEGGIPVECEYEFSRVQWLF